MLSLETSFIYVSGARSYSDLISGFGPTTWWFEVVGPVVSLRFDEVLAEDFPGGQTCDGDGGVVDEHQDTFASVFCSHSEVVYFSCPAQGGFASGVEPVDADSVVGGVAQGLGCGFDGCVVSVLRGVTVERPVGSFGVASVLELL
jgi:hypothetical protein